MNIVKGISAFAIVIISMAFMGLVGVVLAERFGPGAFFLVPAVGVLIIIYTLADAHQWNSFEKELKKEGHSDKTIESVKRGLKQSANGEAEYIGSFAKYTKEKDDD